MGFHVSVNGCSLKTEDNLETAKAIPLDRIMLETGLVPPPPFSLIGLFR